MTTPFFFLLALAFILVHEMDAVRAGEWAILPLLSRLDDRRGYAVFTALHVPLYLILFWLLFGVEAPTAALRWGLDLFFMIHVVLHLLLIKHPRNRFTSSLSWTLILGAGIAGVLDLLWAFG